MEKVYVIIVAEYGERRVVGVANSLNGAENWVDENLREVLDLENEAVIEQYTPEWQYLTYSDYYTKRVDVPFRPEPGYGESWNIYIEPFELIG